MTVLREGRQHIELASDWQVLKWDESHEYLRGQQKSVAGVKAADVVAARMSGEGPTATLLVCEFKDHDHPRIPLGERADAARRAVSRDLADALVRKLIDTLCGATFAHDDAGRRCPELEAWRDGIAPDTAMLVLFCVEAPRSQALAVLSWTKQLQRRLRWLGPGARVIVTSSARPFDGAALGLSYGLS